jgi:molybdopterin/thiamine biosynthesis adenylyltransferase
VQDYFKRQIQLWGEDRQESLKDKSIAIIGCGGLGNSIAIALGSSGIGKIHLVDFDRVSIHNIHRQLSFKLSDENKFKSDVLKEFLDSRISGVDIISHNYSFLEFQRQNIELDLIIDATDNLQSRVAINRFSKKINTPWLYGSVEEFNGQICFFDRADFEEIFKVEKPISKGISAPMVMNIASIQAVMALKYLLGFEIKKDFLNYIYFEDELVVKSFKLPVT